MFRVPTFYFKLWLLLFRYSLIYKREYLSLKSQSLEKAKEYILSLRKQWIHESLKVVGISLTVLGKENLTENESIVYVTNHQGSFDIPCLFEALPINTAFIAKKELFTLPFLGFWIKETGCIPIDRSTPRKGMQSILDAVESIKNGTNLVIFPEGTRSRDPEGKMLPFKKGSLKVAIKSKSKIIPLAIEGTRHVFDKSYQDSEVKVVVSIGEAVETENLSKEEKDNLAESINQKVIELHQRCRNEISSKHD
ncbi:MAG: 1-acyl-sn-glycerol-3-phosphate acyltransferase [Nitrospinae bacterium]|nr:1-acyl-sn-glycerol-3-phosphate acyltransferase [Nitrospinota bacterium]